ncbi:MAG: UvrD-helicase domain-containing protein, partial [Desulfobulbaceae bacterium]|nr:UvrD-helicase domain-containing protein [Desulfobulbaceae bacterium]
GKGVPGLVQRIRSRFAAALIDEFQDTDPVQYRIVWRLFGTGPDPALFMIGDPKQSIYSFRGADIFTYIRARRDTPDSGCFTMETNYRSTTGMVKAVNSLFQQKDSFIFDQDIVFHPVNAGGKADAEPFRLKGKTPFPLQAMIIPPEENADGSGAVITKSRAEDIATQWSAAEISRLLCLGAEGKATFGNRNLTGSDLAVLVRTHDEANLMQRALSRLHIASVYYSQDSIFATEEARQLYQVLFALLDLSDERSVRTAMITDLFGLHAADLYRQQKNDAERETLAAELQEYHQCWHNYGLMAMFEKMLARRHIVQRLLAEQAGERKLTNFLHLVELLQEASLKFQGMDSLIRWFCDQIHDPEPDRANQQLRLESDENLVRIITIHKAKGLEYPIIFLPYLWRARPVKKDRIFSFHEPGTYRILADLGTDDPDHYRLAEQERLAEDLRLLYVAITRARHMCCFNWGRINGLESTPLAWLLHRNGAAGTYSAKMMDDQRVFHDLSRLNSADQLLDYVPYPSDFHRVFISPSVAKKMLKAKVFTGKIDTSWAITSYSQLAASHEVHELQPDVLAAEAESKKEGEKNSVFGFPRGAAAGNCLHGLLEQIDFADIHENELPELVENHLAKTGIEREWTTVVCGWIKDIVETRLSAETDLRLLDIGMEERLIELGFYFSMHNIDIREINRVLRDFSIPPLDARPAYA